MQLQRSLNQIWTGTESEPNYWVPVNLCLKQKFTLFHALATRAMLSWAASFVQLLKSMLLLFSFYSLATSIMTNYYSLMISNVDFILVHSSVIFHFNYEINPSFCWIFFLFSFFSLFLFIMCLKIISTIYLMFHSSNVSFI